MQNFNKPQAIEIKIFSDDRGEFGLVIDDLPNFNPKMGQIKRIYYVVNPSKGTIRGFHYHEKEWKFFIIVKGSAKFVILNPDNPTEIYTFVSSERKPNLIVIPPKYANGWVSLSDNTILICASNATSEGSKVDDKRFDPYQFGDVWTVKGR